MSKGRTDANIHLTLKGGVITSFSIKYDVGEFSYEYFNGRYFSQKAISAMSSDLASLNLIQEHNTVPSSSPKEISNFLTDTILRNNNDEKFSIIVNGTGLNCQNIDGEISYKNFCELLDVNTTILNAKGKFVLCEESSSPIYSDKTDKEITIE